MDPESSENTKQDKNNTTKNTHLGILYSNCRNTKTKKSQKKPEEKTYVCKNKSKHYTGFLVRSHASQKEIFQMLNEKKKKANLVVSKIILQSEGKIKTNKNGGNLLAADLSCKKHSNKCSG